MRLIKKANGSALKITRKEWIEIGKRAQYFGRDPNFDPSDAYSAPDNSWTIGLYENPEVDTNPKITVMVTIDYSVEETEYEGPYVFFSGGITVKDIIIDESFKFRGAVYNAGDLFPDKLIAYTEHETPEELIDAAKEHLSKKVHIPVQRYPLSK